MKGLGGGAAKGMHGEVHREEVITQKEQRELEEKTDGRRQGRQNGRQR